MNNCPNCGKVSGLHSSILQGCMCQYSMQAPPQRTWVGLTDVEKASFWTADQMTQEEWDELFVAIEARLKEKNCG